jgi:RNA polymerase sigma-70 factor (ECF subfamily)
MSPESLPASSLAEDGSEETPERHVERIETATRVHAALAMLSPIHRQAITLREFEDHSYQEIADASACPVGTVMSRLHHARRKLAVELADRSGETDRCAA